MLIVSTDYHIKENNQEQIQSLIEQKLDLADKLKVKNLVCLGDVFDSRKAQKDSVLNCFGRILDNIEERKSLLFCINGNHDRNDNTDTESFLTPFKTHRSLFLYDSYGHIDYCNDNDKIVFRAYFLPYFDEEVYLYYLNEIIKNSKDFDGKKVLFTHQGIEGVKNNDGSKVNNSIKQDLFDNFDLVLVGHYHNRSKLNDKIHYIGSICQNNYGEDKEKGFCVVYSDLSIEYINSTFKIYDKIIIDKQLSKKELNDLILQNKDDNRNVRFEFITTQEDKTLIDIDLIKKSGIDVKIKRKEVEATIELAEQGERIEFTNSSILDEFNKFCLKEEAEYQEYGKELLIKTLK